MNAQELFLKNGSSANVWYCSECRIVTRNAATADNCCVKNNCKYCGKLVEEKYWLTHRECIRKNKIEKAEKLDTWTGWVFYADRYYDCIEALIEELEVDGQPVPDYVYVCKTEPFHKITMDKLLEDIEENSYEGIADSLSNLNDLSDAINYFNKSNEELVSYLPDETRMVKIGR